MATRGLITGSAGYWVPDQVRDDGARGVGAVLAIRHLVHRTCTNAATLSPARLRPPPRPPQNNLLLVGRSNLECDLEGNRVDDAGADEGNGPDDDEGLQPARPEFQAKIEESERTGHGQSHHEGHGDLKNEGGLFRQSGLRGAKADGHHVHASTIRAKMRLVPMGRQSDEYQS